VVDVLAPLRPGTWLLYEAGPTGFGLVRAGAERDIDVVVCAPGSVPRAPGDRVKTDRRDAERRLRPWRAGALPWFGFRGDLTHDRHRLGKCLLGRELRCPTGDRTGSQTWMRWVTGLRF